MSIKGFLFSCAFFSATTAHAATVFSEGTIFVEPNLITSADPSAFAGFTDAGIGIRNMFDRRVNSFNDYETYLFDATFSNGFAMEFQVNTEFGSVDDARTQANFYGFVIGQLPSVLLRDVDEVWIHKGDKAFGGGNNSLLIHTGSVAQGYIDDGILEETMVHEAVHTSLDADHGNDAGWVKAQSDDAMFISPYARANPNREDLAESFLMYLGARHLADRMFADDVAKIEAGIANRLDYFDAQSFDLSPLVETPTPVPLPASAIFLLSGVFLLGMTRRRRSPA